MKILNFINRFLKNRQSKNSNPMLLDSPQSIYSGLLKEPEIKKIINNVPPNLSKIEKAYYVYIELGKIINESPKFVLANVKEKKKRYNDKIDNNYYGICKSISELYVAILNNKFGIQADLVKQFAESPITHVDTILKIDGDNYLVNLIGDLSRIKTSRRVNCFGLDLKRKISNPIFEQMNRNYLKRLEEYYGKISVIDREKIEQMDKKIGYSFFVPQFSNDEDRGIYIDDTIEQIKKELNDEEKFKKYVLDGKDVPKEDVLKYKIEFILNNIDRITEKNGRMDYLENIRFYYSIFRRILSTEELLRIEPYIIALNGDNQNPKSLIKVKMPDTKEEKDRKIYYIFSEEKDKYVYKSKEEIQQFVEENADNLEIIGTFDKYDPRNIGELER